MVDYYFSHQSAFTYQDAAPPIENPVGHIHQGEPPKANMPVSFSLLLILAGVCQAETPDVIWGYLVQYAPTVSPASHPELARLVDYAVTYYQDMIKPTQHYRQPTEAEAGYLRQLASQLADLPDAAAADDIQPAVFLIGNNAGYEQLRQ